MQHEANLATVKKYFGLLIEVSPSEMKAFWTSLSDEEKTFYKEGCAAIMNAAA